MLPDPIITEIRNIREQIAAEFNYDLHAMVKDAQERDAAGDRVVVRREPRPPVQFTRTPAKTA